MHLYAGVAVHAEGCGTLYYANVRHALSGLDLLTFVQRALKLR